MIIQALGHSIQHLQLCHQQLLKVLAEDRCKRFFCIHSASESVVEPVWRVHRQRRCRGPRTVCTSLLQPPLALVHAALLSVCSVRECALRGACTERQPRAVSEQKFDTPCALLVSDAAAALHACRRSLHHLYASSPCVRCSFMIALFSVSTSNRCVEDLTARTATHHGLSVQHNSALSSWLPSLLPLCARALCFLMLPAAALPLCPAAAWQDSETRVAALLTETDQKK